MSIQEKSSETNRHCSTGFTLIEVIIVIAILAVFAAISSGSFRGFLKSSEIDSAAKEIISDLKRTQAKSMTGEGGLKWGIHFVNSANGYYEIFSTPSDYSSASTTIGETSYLSSPIFFIQPAVSSSVIFDKIRGTVGATTTVIISSPDSGGKTITVSPVGNIY